MASTFCCRNVTPEPIRSAITSVAKPRRCLDGSVPRVLHVPRGDAEDDDAAVAQILPLARVIGDPVVCRARVVQPAVGEDGHGRQVALAGTEHEVGSAAAHLHLRLERPLPGARRGT